MVYVTIFFALISLLGGALSFKAHTALPGEPLYVYKLQVNEALAGLAAHTDEAQTRWNFYTLEERLTEARALAAHGHLDVQAQDTLIKNMTEHIANISKAVITLQASGNNTEAAALARTLYQTLTAQTQLASSLSTLGSSNMQISLAPVVTRLRTTSAAAALLATKAEAKATRVDTPQPDTPEAITNQNFFR